MYIFEFDKSSHIGIIKNINFGDLNGKSKYHGIVKIIFK